MFSPNPPVPIQGNVRTVPTLTAIGALSGEGPHTATPIIKELRLDGITTGQPAVLLVAADDLPIYLYSTTVEVTTTIAGGLAGNWQVGLYEQVVIAGAGDARTLTSFVQVGHILDRYVTGADGYGRFPLEWRALYEGWPRVLAPGQTLAFNIGSSGATVSVGLLIRVTYRR